MIGEVGEIAELILKKGLGRNDLCRCGSNLKYKRCCLPKDSLVNNTVIDFKWHKIRQTELAIIEKHLTPFVQSLPKDLLEMAWNDFIVEEELNLDTEVYDEIRYNFFMPWLYFDWVSDGHRPSNIYENITISQLYLQAHPKALSEYEKEFIQTINKTHYSFYIVLGAVSGQSLTIKDLLLDIVCTVKEKSASQTLRIGHIIFARVLEMDEQCIIVGMSPYAITPNKSKIVLDFKKTLGRKARKPLDSKMLRNTYNFELRYLYFDLLDEGFNAIPQLYNTDDEPINMCAVHFALHTTTENACIALAPLMLDLDAQKQFKHALKDKNTLKDAFSFPWLERGNKLHKSWDNPIKGHITIKTDKIIIEVNSQRRAEQARELVERLLQDKATYQATKLQSIETLVQKRNLDNKTKVHSQKQDINLNELPEVREQMRHQIQAHWANWFEQKIPALNNKTPPQAAKTKTGRELLELLFLQYEFINQSLAKDDLNWVDIALLRSKLSLETT